jgi:hypothetical protein
MTVFELSAKLFPAYRAHAFCSRFKQHCRLFAEQLDDALRIAPHRSMARDTVGLPRLH